MNFPKEVLIIIYSYIILKRDTTTFKLTCKSWNNVTKQIYVKETRWKKRRLTCSIVCQVTGNLDCYGIGEYQCGKCNPPHLLCENDSTVYCLLCNSRLCLYCCVANAPLCIECAPKCANCGIDSQMMSDRPWDPSEEYDDISDMVHYCIQCNTILCVSCMNTTGCFMHNHSYYWTLRGSRFKTSHAHD